MSIVLETFFNDEEVKRFFSPSKILCGNQSRNLLYDVIKPTKKIALFIDHYFSEHLFIKELLSKYKSDIVLNIYVNDMPKSGKIDSIIDQLKVLPDVIITIGGGSTIDTAKAVMAKFMYGTYNEVGIGLKRHIPRIKGINKPIFISIPTTGGTGADASRYYVVYDSKTKAKIGGKSWHLIADWIFLDAIFIKSCTDEILIKCSFDCYTHLFETLLCKHENSWFTEMIAKDCIPKLINTNNDLIIKKNRKDENFLSLLYCSALSGITISNVRTSIMHEAAGALLENTDLCHAESLFVFFEETMNLYKKYIDKKLNPLLFSSKIQSNHIKIHNFKKINDWWENIFEDYGIKNDIKKSMKNISISKNELITRIFKRIYSDKVWIEKESPIKLREKEIKKYIKNSLNKFDK